MGTRVKKTRRKERALWKYLNTPSINSLEEFQKSYLRNISSYKCFIGNTKSYIEKLNDKFGDM